MKERIVVSVEREGGRLNVKAWGGGRPLKEDACRRGRQQTGKPGYRKYVRIGDT